MKTLNWSSYLQSTPTEILSGYQMKNSSISFLFWFLYGSQSLCRTYLGETEIYKFSIILSKRSSFDYRTLSRSYCPFSYSSNEINLACYSIPRQKLCDWKRPGRLLQQCLFNKHGNRRYSDWFDSYKKYLERETMILYMSSTKWSVT